MVSKNLAEILSRYCNAKTVTDMSPENKIKLVILMALTLLKLNRVSLKTGFQIALVPGEESVQYKTD